MVRSDQHQGQPEPWLFAQHEIHVQLYMYRKRERGVSATMVECWRGRGLKPASAVLCPWASHFTPRKKLVIPKKWWPTLIWLNNCWLGWQTLTQPTKEMNSVLSWTSCCHEFEAGCYNLKIKKYIMLNSAEHEIYPACHCWNDNIYYQNKYKLQYMI